MKDHIVSSFILNAFSPLLGLPGASFLAGRRYVGKREKPPTVARLARNKRNKAAKLARRRNRR